MEKLKKILQWSPAWLCAACLLFLSFYLLPHIAYFSLSPVILLSEPAARNILSLPDLSRRRAIERMKIKNVEGVVFEEQTLKDLESSGRVFIASGAELVRLFKIQSIASYYVFEQIRDKKLKPDGSYLFFSDAALFEYVFSELKMRLAPGVVAVYERGIFRADASFPDNFILESTLPPDRLRQILLGWSRDEILKTLNAFSSQGSDSLWPVVGATPRDGGSAARVQGSTERPGQVEPPALRTPSFRLNESYLRPPYDSIRIIRDPVELVLLSRGDSLISLMSIPMLHPKAILVWPILLVLIALLRMVQWVSWAPILAAAFVVLTLAFLPTQMNWVVGALAFLLPSAALLLWSLSIENFRQSAGRFWTTPKFLSKFFGILFLFLATPAWLLSTLVWLFPHLPLVRCAALGNVAAPVMAAALFLAVWGIESSGRPLYPRHIRTGLELAVLVSVLIWSESMWILAPVSTWAWARWFVLLDRSIGRAQDDSPGNFAAFIAASALALKFFLICPPSAAALLLAAAPGMGVLAANAWISKTAPSV